MTLRTILVPVDGTEESNRCLDMGFVMGRRVGAHVDTLHVRSDPKDTVPLLGEGMSVAMIEDMMDVAEKEGASRSVEARKTFDAAVQKHSALVTDTPAATGFSARWLEETGREDDAVAAHGRLADLIVAARPTETSDVSTNLTLNAALFETGRPVLVVPPGDHAEPGHRVVISWNGSAQAARAVSSALPLLRGAESITVFTVDSGRTSGERAPELASYLVWHGITANTQTISGPSSTVGPKLLEDVHSEKADLLIMGAYTHSRMRQLILGGVTRHILETADIPVFMAH